MPAINQATGWLYYPQRNLEQWLGKKVSTCLTKLNLSDKTIPYITH